MARGFAVRRRWVVGVSALVLGLSAVVVRVVGVPETAPEPWMNAWFDSPASKTLTVWAFGQHGPAGACGTPQVRFTVHETASEIEVAALTTRTSGGIPIYDGRPYFGPTICSAVAFGVTSASLQLSAPIGGRRIVDAATGRTRSALDASTSASIAQLPTGLRTSNVVAETLGKVHVIRRVWAGSSGGGNQWVDLTVAKDGDLPLLRSRQRVVDGTSVRISGGQGTTRDAYYLQWRLPSGAQANAGVHLAHGVWNEQQVLGIVASTREAVE